MAAKPRIVYVSGAPGAGKTTLARKISAELYLPHVSSDLIHAGYRFTDAAAHHDRSVSFHQAFVPLMQDMAKRGVSFVVDHVLQKDRSKHDVLDKLLPYAHVVIIHVQADNPIKRHLDRELARSDKGRVLDEKSLRERADYHQSNLENTAEPGDYGVPVLTVNATDGYEPEFDQIISFIQHEQEGAKR